MRSRHAEVAGAGLAGLAVATALAQWGWSVRVHERAPELRMFGAGIWLWENGLRSLQVIGARDQAIANARDIKQWAVLDNGEEALRHDFGAGDRMILPLRSDLYEALIAAARDAGVDIVTSSTVTGAAPDGEVVTADGQARQADLVVAADGAFSKIREALMLTDRISYLPEGYTRMIVPALPGDENSVIYECWNGSRRLLYCPCTADTHYIALACHVDDAAGRRVPVDRAYWSELFPDFAEFVDRLGDTGRWDRGMTVRCRSWSAGRVVLVGDAAHGQAPNLGQGANMSFTNAVSLAAAVSESEDVVAGLRMWERTERPLTDHVQRWSHGYGAVVSRWPDALLKYRGQALLAVTSIPWVDAQLNRAARHRPVGG